MQRRRCVVIANLSEYDTKLKPFPAIGTEGIITREVDEFGDYEVMFPDYPCQPHDPGWEAHHTMVVILPDETETQLEEHELCHH